MSPGSPRTSPTSPMWRAIAVAALHVLLISSLGAKLLYDRRTCPQAWFKARQYDPNLPIRGRYMSLQVEVLDPRSPEEIESKFGSEIRSQENSSKQFAWHGPFDFGHECGSIAVRDGAPVAVFEPEGPSRFCDNLTFSRQRAESAGDNQAAAPARPPSGRWGGGHITLRVNEPVLFFVPDTAQLPTPMGNGSELWVLATVPRTGPPRAIALGVKKAGESEIRRLGFY